MLWEENKSQDSAKKPTQEKEDHQKQMELQGIMLGFFDDSDTAKLFYKHILQEQPYRHK